LAKRDVVALSAFPYGPLIVDDLPPALVERAALRT
jgi:hypothetical protein